MVIDFNILQAELLKTDECENEIARLDWTVDKAIFKQLYVPLSQGKDVMMGDVDLSAFDYENILEFLSGLEDKSRLIYMQGQLAEQCFSLKADTKNTKQFF